MDRNQEIYSHFNKVMTKQIPVVSDDKQKQVVFLNIAWHIFNQVN